MAVTFRQWADAFDSEVEETGCSLTITDPQTYNSEIEAIIASASDTADEATAVISNAAKLPTGEEGRVRFYWRVPAGWDVTSGNMVFLHINFGGTAVLELYLTTGENLRIFATTNTIDGAFNVATTQNIVADTEYLIEMAWRKNDFITVWVNDSSVYDNQTLSGSTGDATIDHLAVGIDHYDGVGATGLTCYYRLFQIADDADVALEDPVEEVGKVYKRFLGPENVPSTPTTLYTVPAGRRARVLHIHASTETNTSIDIYLGDEGAGWDVSDQVYEVIEVNPVFDTYDPYDLSAGESIGCGKNPVAQDAVITISGYEESA